MGTTPPLSNVSGESPFKQITLDLILRSNVTYPTSATQWNNISYNITDTYGLENRTGGNFTEPFQCTEDSKWEHAQHMLYQLGNVCIVVSFLTLSSFKYHYIFLRSFFMVGCLPLAMWAGFMTHMKDIMLWNIAFLVINIVFIAHYAYVNRPPKMELAVEELYKKTFKPLKVTSIEYDMLIKLGSIKMLSTDVAYAVEEATLSGYRLSILLRGRLKVSHNECFLHYISPDEFIDSIEYEGVDTSQQRQDTYQVTITADEDSSLITWQQNELDEFLSTNLFLSVLMRNLLGRDISTKMYHIQELLLAGSRKKRKQTNNVKPIKHSSRTHSTDYIRLNNIANADDQSEPLLAKSSSYETCV